MVVEKRPRPSGYEDDDASTLLKFLAMVVKTVTSHNEEDIILKCDCDHLDRLEDHADELFALADQKLHVFPFKEVNPCWFRLFTDTSIIRAVRLTRFSLALPINEATNPHDWIEKAVSILDMAIIMAGGLGREELVTEVFARLQTYIGNVETVNQEKRRRQGKSSTKTRNSVLPQQRVSLPLLKHPVDQLQCPSLSGFSQWMQRNRLPALLLDTMSDWPALQQWSKTSYWVDQTLGGRRLVPIETGRSYIDDGWGQKIIPFGEFLDTYIFSEGDPDSARGYLAQHDLFRQLPALRSAFRTPDYCYLDAPGPEPGTPLAIKATVSQSDENGEPNPGPSADTESATAEDHDVQRNIWFGPAWTITPLHHDPYHNILCQVVGTKHVRLYSPRHSAELKPMSKAEAAPHLASDSHEDTNATIDMSNTSQIDIAAMELSPHEDWDAVYPGISELPYLECLLEPGQALYIPIGWWHYVRSCSVGISVSFWW